MEKYGDLFYIFASIEDIAEGQSALSLNNAASKVHFGKQLEAVLFGMGIVSVDPKGNVKKFGFFNMDTFLDDEIAHRRVAAIRKEVLHLRNISRGGDISQRQIDLTMEAMSIAAEYTMEEKFPGYVGKPDKFDSTSRREAGEPGDLGRSEFGETDDLDGIRRESIAFVMGASR